MSEPVTVPPIVYDVLRSPGQPLDAATRAFFEPRFGHDFSQVRVHTDACAAESARAVNALAYTVGRDIVFGGGQYARGASAGRTLLAHELAHTVQQGQSPAVSSLTMSHGADDAEREAESSAQAIGRMEPTHVTEEGVATLAREEADAGPKGGPPTRGQAEAPPGEGKSPPGAGGPKAKPPPPASCTPPTAISLGATSTLEFRGYLTGGGICALMQVSPAVENLCPPGPTEELTLVKGATTCPDSLITGGLCQGDKTFPLGKPQGGACKPIKPKANEFVDRHSVELEATSILHDQERNPKRLDHCTFACDQEYYVPAKKGRTTLSHFLIHSKLKRDDGKKITEVTVTKTAKS